jgi:CBS domain-containing protein
LSDPADIGPALPSIVDEHGSGKGTEPDPTNVTETWDKMPYRWGVNPGQPDGMTQWPTAGFARRLGGLPLDPPTVVSETDSLRTVALFMADHQVSCALLREPPLRVVTEHDLAQAWRTGCSPDDKVATIATRHPYWAPASTTPAAAGAMMINLGIRHLIVLDVADLPLGIISMAKLFAILVQDQEPRALYASFTEVLERVAWEQNRPEPK